MHVEGKETFEWLRMDVGELRRGRPPSTSTARKRLEMAPTSTRPASCRVALESRRSSPRADNQWVRQHIWTMESEY